MDMKRVAVLSVGILVLAFIPAVVSAQGFLPGLPSFGGIYGGGASCGEPPCPGLGPLVGYVGWMPAENRNVGFGVGGDPVGGIYQLDQEYDQRGLWLGLQSSCCLSNRLGFMATGWYLFPSNSGSTEVYNNGIRGTRTWDTSTQWWFVDGAFLIGGPCGLSAIVGLRFDYFNTQFSGQSPFNSFGLGLASDEATVRSEGWIPLFGTQYALASSGTNLTVRVVGVPALLGNVRYRETIGGLGGAGNAELSGTYNNGYFLEVFSEYSRTFAGGGVGVFARWNMAHGNSDLDVTLDGLGSAGFKLGLNRTSWTFGGSFTLNFNTPI
jgi:hypothetical protein